MKKIIIGTANFGSKYGALKNKFFIQHKKEFINYLTKKKINTFDCALDYNYKIENLELLNKEFKIIYKSQLFSSANHAHQGKT